MICSKTHMTLGDTAKVLNSSYHTLRPEWKKLSDQIRKEGKIIGKYGIKAQRVLDYFDIDVNQLIRLEQYEKEANV